MNANSHALIPQLHQSLLDPPLLVQQSPLHLLEFLQTVLPLDECLVGTKIGLGLHLDSSLLVGLVLIVHKGTRKIRTHKLHVPLGLARHTLGNNRVLEKEPRHTALTSLVGTIEALDLPARSLVERVGTNGTLHDRIICINKKSLVPQSNLEQFRNIEERK